MTSEFDESSNNVRVELNCLPQAKIITSKIVGRALEYYPYEEHSLFNELQSLVRNYADVDRLVETLTKNSLVMLKPLFKWVIMLVGWIPD